MWMQISITINLDSSTLGNITSVATGKFNTKQHNRRNNDEGVN